MGMKITLDTNIFLNVKNKEEPFYKFSKSILEAVDSGDQDLEAIISVITITELCVGYYRNNELIDKDEFLSGLSSNKNYKIIDYDSNTADKTAELRSKINLKLPDCAIIATTIIEKSETLITNDSGFDKATSLIKIYNSQEFFEKYLRKENNS